MSDETIHVDGDRLIAFIKAVQNAGKILEQVQLGDMAKAFIKDQQCGTISDIINRENAWKEALLMVSDKLKEHHVLVKLSLEDTRALIGFVRTIEHTFNNPEFNKAVESAERLSAVMDNIERHRKIGTIDLISKL